jgi:hypothetical protein
MSVRLIVKRTEGEITLDDWKRAVTRHSDLRIRQEPYIARNPRTGDTIELPAGPADAELNCEGQWISLLRYSRGKLKTEYSAEYEDSGNVGRLKIAQLARELGAVVMTDIADEPLSW